MKAINTPSHARNLVKLKEKENYDTYIDPSHAKLIDLWWHHMVSTEFGQHWLV